MILTVKNLLLAVAFIFCVSASSPAQKDERKTPPKGGDPPVVVVEPKRERPKEDRPKEDRDKDNRRKKPQAFFPSEEVKIEIGFI